MKNLFIIGVMFLISSFCWTQGKIILPSIYETSQKEKSNPKSKAKVPDLDVKKSIENPLTFIIDNNLRKNTSHGYFKISKVEIFPTKTMVYFTFYPNKEFNWGKGGYGIWSDKSEYIENSITNQKLYIKDSEIGFQGHELRNSNPFTYIEIYPPIPVEWTKINIGDKDFLYIQNFIIRQN